MLVRLGEELSRSFDIEGLLVATVARALRVAARREFSSSQKDERVISRRRFLHGLWPLGMAALRASPARAASPADEGVEHAAATIRDAIARGDIPGAVLHVRAHGQIRCERAFGRKDIDGDLDLTPDALFPVASLTKPVVAAAILKLAEDRAVRLGDPVATYLPVAHPRVLVKYDARTGALSTRPARRAMTLRDLLMHTAGIHHGLMFANVLRTDMTLPLFARDVQEVVGGLG